MGHIRKIELQGWHALAPMRLDGDVHLPTNSTAKIGLTSILGSQHIELKARPPTRRPRAVCTRAHDSVVALGLLIPQSRTLAAVSTVLNGGGLGQIQDITEAFSTAFRGREQDLRSMITELDRFAANFN